MPIDPEVLGALQARERVLEADLRDACVWLEERHGVRVALLIERHYWQACPDVARVEVLTTDRDQRRAIRPDAQRALEHLGYQFNGTDADTWTTGAQSARHMSAHERLAALARFSTLD